MQESQPALACSYKIRERISLKLACSTYPVTGPADACGSSGEARGESVFPANVNANAYASFMRSRLASAQCGLLRSH